MINSALRGAGKVKRYHTMHTHGSQTVAEHSFYVCLLLTELVDKPSVALLKAALYHDLPEHETGDIPATTKWKYPKLAEEVKSAENDFIERHGLAVSLPDKDWLALKYADMGELVMYSIDQIMLGNRNMVPVGKRGLDFLKDLPYLSDRATMFINKLSEEFDDVCK
jgi:hypothetical protein